jgi:hypothetical protein
LPEIFYQQGEQDGSGDHLFPTYNLGNAVVVPVYAWRNNNRWDKPGAVWNAARSRWIANIAAFIGLRQFATCGNMPH